MSKISDLNQEELIKYIESYERRVKKDPSNLDHQRKLTKLKHALENFSKTTAIAASPRTTNKTKSAVKKFHTSDVDYSSAPDATFAPRAVALFLDGVILGVGTQVISTTLLKVLIGTLGNSITVFAIFLPIIINIFLPVIYYVYFLRKDGQTLGKKVMKIRVLNSDYTPELSVGTIIMRETLGKFISGLVFGLGYIIFLFGKETWHDRMANTTVVSVK